MKGKDPYPDNMLPQCTNWRFSFPFVVVRHPNTVFHSNLGIVVCILIPNLIL
jgi:hypothetical protein